MMRKTAAPTAIPATAATLKTELESLVGTHAELSNVYRTEIDLSPYVTELCILEHAGAPSATTIVELNEEPRWPPQ